MTSGLIIYIVIVLTFALGVFLIALVDLIAALIKLIHQLRFYFFIMTESHNQSLRYPIGPTKVSEK